MRKILSLLFLLVATAITTNAQDIERRVVVTETIEVINDTVAKPQSAPTSTLPPAYYDTEKHTTHFAWGVDLGSSIDMTNQELSSVDISACVGYKGSIFRFIGVGGQIKMMINNGSRAYPLYGMIRTGFTKHATPAFLELRAGVSIANLRNDVYQRPFFGGVAVGYTLASGRTFSSHVTVGYDLMMLKDILVGEQTVNFSYLHSASIKIGICF
jgi:hypothetical protein